MSERPILFSGPMIRAILDGRKTQTRRIVKPQPIVRRHWSGPDDHGLEFKDRTVRITSLHRYQEEIAAALCPYGARGDRLWVRETFHLDGTRAQHEDAMRTFPVVFYRATEAEPSAGWRWRPSIYMPRWASRITLEVTSVRAERLQDITGEDARAEGIDYSKHACDCEMCARTAAICPAASSSLIMEYASLWDSINAKRASYSSNPWVLVVSFRRLR
jgi:hypothetical protein